MCAPVHVWSQYPTFVANYVREVCLGTSTRNEHAELGETNKKKYNVALFNYIDGFIETKKSFILSLLK